MRWSICNSRAAPPAEQNETELYSPPAFYRRQRFELLYDVRANFTMHAHHGRSRRSPGMRPESMRQTLTLVDSAAGETL
jgi:hypothetical protein